MTRIELLTDAEVAHEMGLSMRQFYRCREIGYCPVWFTKNGRNYTTRTAMDAWLAEHEPERKVPKAVAGARAKLWQTAGNLRNGLESAVLLIQQVLDFPELAPKFLPSVISILGALDSERWRLEEIYDFLGKARLTFRADDLPEILNRVFKTPHLVIACCHTDPPRNGFHLGFIECSIEKIVEAQMKKTVQ